MAMQPVLVVAAKNLYTIWNNVSFAIDGSVGTVLPILGRDITEHMAMFAKDVSEKQRKSKRNAVSSPLFENCSHTCRQIFFARLR